MPCVHAALLRVIAFVACVAGLAVPVAAAEKDQAIVFAPALDSSTILPGSDIASFAQDRQGFLWMATDGGLARWDGTTLAVIGAEPGSDARLPQFRVTDVAGDESSGVWAAAGELVHVDPWSNRVKRTGILAEVLAARGFRLWVMGPGPLTLLDTRSGQATRVRGSSPTRSDGLPVSAAVDAAGRLYMGLDWGVQIVAVDGTERSVVIPGGVRGVTTRRAGGVWAISDSGLWRVSPASGRQPRRVAVGAGRDGAFEPAAAAVELPDGRVLIARRDSGVAVYRPGSRVIGRSAGRSGAGAAHGLPRTVISSLFVDDRDEVWASAGEAGLFRDADIPAPSVRTLPPVGPGSTPALDLHADADGIWVAAGAAGLRRFDLSTGRWSGDLTPGRDGEPVVAVAPAAGGLWLSVGDGLALRDAESGRLLPLPLLSGRRVSDAVPAPDGALWVLVDEHGVEVLDPSGRPRYFLGRGGAIEIENDHPRAVLPGVDVSWVGGTRGLERVDLRDGRVDRWSSQDGQLAGDTVFDIAPALNGGLWLATSAGLELFNPNRATTTYYGRAAGLPGTTALELRPHAKLEALWVATSRGLALFDLLRRETTSVYTRADGLASSSFIGSASAQASDGRSYFGSSRGLVEVAPDAGVGSGLDAQVHVTAMHVDGRRVDPTATPVLSRGSSVRFDFSLPEYTDPDSVRFRYRLRGSGSEWVDVTGSERSLSFRDLSSGRYRLELEARALGSDDIVRSGPEVGLGGAVRFEVARPLWQHPLVVAGGALAMLILGAGVNFGRTRQARRRAQEFEELVSTRTEELAHAAMQAEQANESKSRFMTMISHELRSPLHALMGYAELIEASADDDDLREWAGSAVAASSHLGSMIEDLLAVARRDEFATNSSPHRVDMATFLRQTVDMSRRARQTRCAVTLQSEGLREHYSINERRVRQLLVNLLDNAIRHCDSEVRLEVSRIGPRSDTTELVRFAVSDDGPGVPEALREEIFQPFFRGAGSTGSGLGLGLAVSAQIAEMLGSELRLGETDDGSTLFWFDLRTEPLAAGGAPDSSQGLGLLALVVDDEQASRTVVSECLRSLGYDVRAAASGVQALDLLRAGLRPAVVITDHLMPVVGGGEVAAGVRTMAHLDGVPVVAATAVPEAAAEVDDYDAVLAKPVSRSDLERVLGRELAEASS